MPPAPARLADDGLSASAAFGAQLEWRHSFGGKRSKDVPLEVTLERVNGAWRMSSCGVSGSVGALR